MSSPTSDISAPPGASGARPIEVDPQSGAQLEDNDSALGESRDESTASISSTILDYRKLHGRTYQNFEDVEYWGPNDEKQNEGLDITHHMLYLAHKNKLFQAPLKEPQKVIDIGTGTGIWAIDFADEFPMSHVIGTDLSPIQPSWVPPNCTFVLDDASKDWTYEDNTFDYIHIRCLLGCVKDWVKLYKECLRCLKPGGWLEHSDFSVQIMSDDGSLPPDSAWADWRRVFTTVGEKTGKTFDITDDNKFVRWMEEAGFADVRSSLIKIPLGDWPADPRLKEVGIFARLAIEEGLEGFALYICTNVLGWKYDEVQVLCAKVRAALKNRSYHAYYPCGTAWAQKPEK